MSGEVTRYVAGRALAPRDARKVERSISRQQVGQVLREQQIENELEVAGRKADAAAWLTGSELQRIAQVAQVQQQLEMMIPSASGRLNMLADQHALDSAQDLRDFRHQLRRL